MHLRRRQCPKTLELPHNSLHQSCLQQARRTLRLPGKSDARTWTMASRHCPKRANPALTHQGMARSYCTAQQVSTKKNYPVLSKRKFGLNMHGYRPTSAHTPKNLSMIESEGYLEIHLGRFLFCWYFCGFRSLVLAVDVWGLKTEGDWRWHAVTELGNGQIRRLLLDWVWGILWRSFSHTVFRRQLGGAGCGFNKNGEIVRVTKAYVRRFGLLWDFSFVVGLGRGSGEARGGKGILSLTFW